MGEILRLSKGDYGTNINYTIHDDTGAARDISSASSIKIRIGRYGETNCLVEGTMSFVNDGTDGQVSYTLQSTDLVTAGYYDVEIFIAETSSKFTTRTFTLHIVDSLNTVAT